MQDRLLLVKSSQELLEVNNANPEDTHTRIVTGDETLRHHWGTDTKKESMQWKLPGTPHLKKCTQSSAGKVTVTFFFRTPKGLN